MYGFTYDKLGRVIRETDPEGAEINLVLDVQDAVTSHADPIGVTTSYVRNGFGDIIQETNPDIRNARLKEERAKEVQRLCQIDWSSSTKHQTKERRAAARRFLNEALGELGFRTRPDLSVPGWIVLSRPIADQWELRFGIAISSSTVYEHIFACKTSLRKELLVWPTLYDPSEYVEVLLQNTALEFGRTYHSFTNSQEFEVDLRAILFLYGLEHEFIIKTITENI